MGGLRHDYQKDTMIIGTVGEKKRIECLCFEGDFEYRVHIQNPDGQTGQEPMEKLPLEP